MNSVVSAIAFLRRRSRALLYTTACAGAGLAATVTWFAPATAVPTKYLVDAGPGVTVDIDEPGKPGRPGPNAPEPSRVLQDTVWIADWSFDGMPCTSAGWTIIDNRVRNDGSNYWSVDNRFAGTGGITNRAAVLAKHDLCWERDGYGNAWDYSVVLKYGGGAATLDFDILSDSNPGDDHVTVEADSLGLSESRVNYLVDPAGTPETFRSVLYENSGPDLGSHVGSIPLPNFGAGVHEVYIRFESSDQGSDEDGDYPSTWNAGLVVDNVAVTGNLTYSEGFEGALGANVSLVNTAPVQPFGTWARLFSHITDNDKATENLSCAWLFTDPLRIAFTPQMGFGPGGAVVRNWLDNVVASPWVSLASTPSAPGTVLTFRTFPGNRFNRGKIVQSWRVRTKTRVENTDTPMLGDSLDCVTPWQLVDRSYFMLNTFTWQTHILGMNWEMGPAPREVQIATRVTDWQFVADAGFNGLLDTGPGPYVDRIRIGRRVGLAKSSASSSGTGPWIEVSPDTRMLAQDAFATVVDPSITPGEHHVPDGSNRFGTCAFSAAADLGINAPGSSRVVTSDSISFAIVPRPGTSAGIPQLWGAITSGPHAGKVPPGCTPNGSGFFTIDAESVVAESGEVIPGRWCVDLDDTYFRGGDRLEYFLLAVDDGGGFQSYPLGLTAAPASVTAARVATGGLLEFSSLPAISWDPAYLAAIAAHPSGDIDPSPVQLANSSQRNCILYVNAFAPERRSSSRTSVMYTLDALGYANDYDVYDMQGSGNVNNHLGSRANVGQASAYALVIQDSGRRVVGTIPDGSEIDFKVNQAQWYRDYLAQGSTGLAGTATLWLIGENVAFENRSNPLLAVDCGISSAVDDQALVISPTVAGVSNFTWASGNSSIFVGDRFSLNGGFPVIRNFDGMTAGGTAVGTHRYQSGMIQGPSAIVANRNVALDWNTIVCGFSWFDLVHESVIPPAPDPGSPDAPLMNKILNGVLPIGCVEFPTITDAPDATAAPRLPTALHPNVPNPFNPTTTLTFDLAQPGRVRLQIYDVAGHLVRTLVDEVRTAGRHRAVWSGLGTANTPCASGIYFARLDAPDAVFTRRLVLVR